MNTLLGDNPHTASVLALKESADAGDAVLADILQREGAPDRIDAEYVRPWVFARLHYRITSGLVYVLRCDLETGPWLLMKTETASHLPEYQDQDTAEGYRDYLSRFPDDPPAAIDAAQGRLDELEAAEQAERREAEEERQRTAIAEAPMEEFVHTHRRLPSQFEGLCLPHWTNPE